MPSDSSPAVKAASAELGLSASIPPAPWFRQPPPRAVDTKRLVRTSYGSRTGRSLVGLGLALGIPFLTIELLAMRDDPRTLVILVPGAIFIAFLFAVPALPARRLARALRVGRVARATVTDVTVRRPGTGPTIDAMTNGFAAGRLRLDEHAGGDEIKFETDAVWATRLKLGGSVEVLVDPGRKGVLWIIGPVDGVADGTDSIPSNDRDASRTMPGR